MFAFGSEADPSRLAAQVVSGIGFLGAGTIIRTGNDIKGLTTAASLWVCAGIGLAIGAGYYLGGIITAGIVLLSLIALGSVEKKVSKNLTKVFHIVGKERPGLVGDIGTIFGKYYITIKDISIIESDETDEDDFVELSFTVKTPTGMNIDEVINELYAIQKVAKITLDGKIVNINGND